MGYNISSYLAHPLDVYQCTICPGLRQARHDGYIEKLQNRNSRRASAAMFRLAQQEVGTGYFDEVTNITRRHVFGDALHGSTEEDQSADRRLPFRHRGLDVGATRRRPMYLMLRHAMTKLFNKHSYFVIHAFAG